MSEDVYAKPDLTKKVRYGRREREGEREGEGEEEGEDREEWEDRIVYSSIYVTAKQPDPNPDPGIQKDAVQNNTAQQQHGGGEVSKQNRYIAAAVCVGLLCLLLLAGIIVLVILYCASIKEKNYLQSRHDNMTGQKDKLQTRLNNMAEQKDNLQTRLNNMTAQKDQWNTRFEELQTRHDNMTKQKDKLQTSFDELKTRHTNLIERDDIKKILCESREFTFGDGVCYLYISTESKTWEESRAYCTAKQSDLIIINSKEKQDLVVRVVVREQSVWMGLTDSETEGVWKWVDGTPLTTATYWRGTEPNDFVNGGEDCVELYQGGWNDGPCSANRPWMCEIVI